MRITKRLVVALVALIAAPSAQAQLDVYGDALPEGAVARLGTARFRHSFSANQLVYAPNGKILASGGQSSGVRLWDAQTGRLLHHLVGERFAASPAFSPDGTKVFTGLRLFEVATGKELLRFKSPDDVREAPHAAWSRNGRIIATGPHANNKVVFWDAATGTEIRRTPGQGQNSSIVALAFSPTDDVVLAVADVDKTIRIWDAATAKPLHQIKAHEKQVHCIAFTPDGGTLVSGGEDGLMRFWDVKSGKQLHEIKPGHPTVSGVALTADGKWLAASGAGGAISLWDAQSRTEIRRWETHVYVGSAVAFSPDGKTLAVGAGCAIGLWNPATGQEINPISAHRGFVEAIRFAADGKSLFSCGDDKQAIQWDLTSGRSNNRLARGPLGPTGTDRWFAMDIAPDGQTLAVNSLDTLATDRAKMFIPGIQLWNTASGAKIGTLLGHTGRVREFRFSPNSKILASTDLDGGIKLWDVAACKEIHQLGAGIVQNSLTFSTDGKLVTAAGGDGLTRQWDVASGKELRKWDIGDGDLFLIASSPDGRLIGGSSGRGVGVWSADTGKQLAQFNRSVRVSSLAFSPNSRVLATSSFGTDTPNYDQNNARIQLWELRTGQEIRMIPVPNSYLFQIAFSPDGQTLASAGSDSSVMLWEATGQARRADGPRTQLTANQLDALWADLRADAAKAEPAIWSLALAAEQATPFLKERLRPAPPADAKQTEKLLTDLGGNNFNVREQAERALIELAAAAEPALRRFVQNNPPLEMQRRLERILEKRAPDELRHLRTIDALEQIGSPEAREVLRWLATETVNPRVRTGAESTLVRLATTQDKGKDKTPPAPLKEGLATFHIGNSLTNTTGKFPDFVRTAGIAHKYQSFTAGGHLTWQLWENQLPKRQEEWNKKLAAYKRIDHFTIQPRDFTKNSVDHEADYAIRFFELIRKHSPEMQPWFYAEWVEKNRGRPTDQGKIPSRQMKTTYPAKTWEESMAAMLLYNEDLQAKVVETYKEGKRPRVLPSCIAMGWIKNMIDQSKFPGADKDAFYPLLFSDAVHPNVKGGYLVDLTWYAAFYRESPEGKILPTGTGLTDEQAKVMQKLAWDVVKNYPDCGLYEEGTTPVAAPEFVSAGKTVTLTSKTPGAWFRYTLDGTTPTRTRGYVYCGVISVPAGGATLKAVAYKSGMADSGVTEMQITAGGQ